MESQNAAMTTTAGRGWTCWQNKLTCHFKLVHNLWSREDFPLSVYHHLVQGLCNDINRGFTYDIDEVLEVGSRQEVISMVKERFNMDGENPSGRKVGLLNRHHLMAFLCDPFCHEWRSSFKIQTSLARLMKEMINVYIPMDEDGSATSRQRILTEFKVWCAPFSFIFVVKLIILTEHDTFQLKSAILYSTG